ncbi:MAG: tetratricopeptide repeat protein [Elusimicrobia bacterium]|nr:tetratricopeptide repeat protein [Elusimicrobiota bacterium]
MGKQWVRQEIKRNELQELVDRVLLWASSNQQLAAAIGGGTAAAALLAGILIYRSHSMQSAAWDRLALAEDSAYAGQVESSLKQISELAAQYPNTAAAGYGYLFQGDLLYPRGQYKEALEAYNKVLESGQPKVLQPLALGDTALAQEAAGQCEQSALSAQRFLETYPDHFLAPQVHACLARCLQARGQADQARTAYQKITLQYPETSWALWAKKRLDSPAAAK